jgi:undecaprenyl-diphosphatase
VTLRTITHLGGARATIGTSIVLLVVGEWRLGFATALANAVSHVAVQILKRTVARARPCDALGHPLALVELPDPFSFPSGHAAAASAISATAVYAQPWSVVLLLPLAIGVAYSRVALRVHHVSDVVAGVVLGLLGALAAIVLLF